MSEDRFPASRTRASNSQWRQRASAAKRIAAACLVAWLQAAGAAAQLPEQDPIESMPFRFGPLGISPSLAITDVGVDSNVFSDPENPREDFTATIVPRVVLRLRAGPLLLSAANATGFVYFHEFADERNVNYSWDTLAELTFARLQPYLAAAVLDTRDRLNAEIDIRAPRRQTSVSGGARVAVAARTSLTFEMRESRLTFDEGVSFEGVPLSRTMNDRTSAFEAGVQFSLTPLTTLALTSSWQRDRFDEAPERDADSLRIAPSLQFDPDALIQGTLTAGYRRFDPLGPLLAPYSGPFVRTSLGYTLLERTKFDVRIGHDVQYSFEVDEPYYLATSARFEVIHRLVGPFDVRAAAGRERLSYRELATGSDDRADTVDLVMAGVGYRLRDDIGVSLSWESIRRASDLPDRRYDRHRIVASFTYGI